MTQVLHQLGYRYQWNLESITGDGTGDGVICGPRYMTRARVEGLPLGIRENSLFDPQFFLPHSSRGALSTYPFFPQVVAGGFSTTDWTDAMASQCAMDCLRFQNDCGFRALVIPTRFYDGMPASFVDDQDRQFVIPFLEASSRLRIERPLYLQVILTDFMLRDQSYSARLLNWITSYSELSGVYLIYHVQNRRKQLQDTEFLLNLFAFLQSLKRADLAVVVGYANTEGVLLLCTGADAITMGSYENLRMFSVDAFDEPRDGPRYGPNVRLYVPRLLQWVEQAYMGAIRRAVGDLGEYLEDNQYRVRMFEPEYNWHFTKPEPYKHFFVTYSTQLRRLSVGSPEQRYPAVLAECESALVEHQRLQAAGMVMDPESSGQHLNSWISVLNIQMRRIS